MAVTLYHPETGKPIEASPEEAQKAVLEGTLGPLKDQRVPVVLADGTKGTVLGSTLHENISRGARIYDPEAEAHAAEVEAEDTPTGFVGAAGLSGLSGITGGLSTGLIRKGIQKFGSPEAAKNFQHDVDINREAWPKTHLVGNVAGAAGAAYLSGGLSEAGGAGALSRLVPAAGIDAVGGLVERGVAKAVAGVGGEGMAAVAGRAAVQTAARAGTEGALFAASDHVGEDILGDAPTAADKLFVATAKGGAFGLGLGTVLGGAGSLVRSARGAARKGGGALISEAATEASTAAREKLVAAEAAHADATKRAGFAVADGEGGRTFAMGPSSLHNPEGYKNPFEVDAIHDTYDKSGQLVRPEAPPAQKAFDIGSMRREAGVPNADAGLYSDEIPAELGGETKRGDVFKIAKGDTQTTRASRRAALDEGLSGEAKRSYRETQLRPAATDADRFADELAAGKLQDPTPAQQQFHLNNAKEIEARLLEVRAAQDSGVLTPSAPSRTQGPGKVRFAEGFSEGEGPIGQGDSVFNLGPKKADVSLKQQPTGLDGLKPSPTGSPIRISKNAATAAENDALRRGEVFAEDPIVAARRSAAEAEVATTKKDLEQAIKDAEEAQDLHKLSAEVQAGDPHSLIDRLAWQSTGADAGITKRVNKFPGGIDRAGATMRRLGILDVAEGEGAVKATLGSFSENTPEKMLGRTETKLNQLLEEMQGIGGTRAHATLSELLAPLDAQIAKLSEVSTTVPVARQLAAQRQMLLGTPKFASLLDVDGKLIAGAEKSPVSLSDIIAERRGVGRKAYAVGDVHANIMKESNAALYKAWDELEQKALEAAEKGLGGKFKGVKTDIADLINVEKALEGKIARASSARAFGVLPHMAGMAGSSIGGAVLPVAGHVVGHALGMMLSKSVMDRGNAAAAVALTKIADIGAVRHLMEAVDAKVARAAKGITSTTEAKATKVRVVGGSASGADRESKRPPIAQRYRDAIEKLDAMESQDAHARAMQATQDLAQHAPKVAGFFATGVARAAAYLSSKRPQPLTPALAHTDAAPSILDTDKLAFVQAYEAGSDPGGVLDRVANRTATPGDLEALKAVAPTVHADLEQKVMAEIASRRAAGKPMLFRRRMELALLFPDMNIEPALEPATYRMLQKNVFTEPPPDQPPSKGGKSNAPRRPVKLPNSANPLDRLAQSGAGRR